MQIYSFLELLQFARQHSPFYRELYKTLGESPKLEELPIVDSVSFWAANGPVDNQVLTSRQRDGLVFKSGGTSGNAKFSYFAKEEWDHLNSVFGLSLGRGGLKDGERLANFFYAGDLYASFIFIMRSIEASGRQVLRLPLGGTADSDNILKTLNEFQVDVWAGPPTTLMKIAELVKYQSGQAPRKILFGGESFYPDQRAHLLALFPGVEIRSVGYASVDAGLIGFVDSDCGPQEHRVFSNDSIVEIVDPETLEPIHQPQQTGKILLTNRARLLMPIIRYPVGDLGAWIEPESVHHERKFKILGRSEEGARVGPTTIYYDDLAACLQLHQHQLQASGFQLVIRHFDKLDQLIVRVARNISGQNDSGQNISDRLSAADFAKQLEHDRPVLKQLAQDKKLHPVHVEFVEAADLSVQKRTGKLKRIIDERFLVKFQP